MRPILWGFFYQKELKNSDILGKIPFFIKISKIVFFLNLAFFYQKLISFDRIYIENRDDQAQINVFLNLIFFK